MPTLKEIKGRIASVRNTLKITSAMKLVASAKLRKAQKAIENMRPYEEQLQAILASLQGGMADQVGGDVSVMPGPDRASGSDRASGPCAIVAIASNSSLCGGFNAAAVAKVREVRREGDVVYAVGRKMADAMRRDGFPSPEDLNALVEHPAFAPAADLVESLSQQWEEGKVAQVLLVYNHFVSTARQVPVVEVLLGEMADQVGHDVSVMPGTDRASAPDLIVEPSRKEMLKLLLPKTRKLKLYAALLDSVAAEHAARTVAMQTATDNGENLLQELTLQYNKGRQQKITSEILDLAGGQAEN
ncbi:MAG: ATP synthase F1 subunit gamma [Bacteroidales bacterium]|nr:ATP synthase F1 subunit gamma [Bacteroidales bacterium]MBR1783733.1 ATP synthase F1 subunit gamma [Bacteroidales bacterium]